MAGGLRGERRAAPAAPPRCRSAQPRRDIRLPLLERARARLPEDAANIHAGNAWFSEPARRYDFVIVLLGVCPPSRLPGFLQRVQRDFLAPGGRLICSLDLCDPDAAPAPKAARTPAASRSRAGCAWVDSDS
jgi:hypothetical protein